MIIALKKPSYYLHQIARLFNRAALRSGFYTTNPKSIFYRVPSSVVRQTLEDPAVQRAIHEHMKCRYEGAASVNPPQGGSATCYPPEHSAISHSDTFDPTFTEDQGSQ